MNSTPSAESMYDFSVSSSAKDLVEKGKLSEQQVLKIGKAIAQALAHAHEHGVVVLEQLRDEMLDWHGQGMSVMEMSHRGKAFVGIAQQAEADLRELLAIPSNYKVLFLQGGATAQFAAIPLNLTRSDSVVDYVNTPCDLRAQSKHFNGVPDAIVQQIVAAITGYLKSQITAAPPDTSDADLWP